MFISFFFFFNDTATTEIYTSSHTLSLHDALPILVFYSVIEVLSGFAPNYTTFMVLRALFGIGMGGEWGVGASLAMEKVPARLRGVLSGLLQEGYACGYLLAAVFYFFV